MNIENESQTVAFGIGLIKEKAAIKEAVKKHFPYAAYAFVPLYTKGRQPYLDEMMVYIKETIRLRRDREILPHIRHGHFIIVTPNLNNPAIAENKRGHLQDLFKLYSEGYLDFGLMSGSKIAVIEDIGASGNRLMDEWYSRNRG